MNKDLKVRKCRVDAGTTITPNVIDVYETEFTCACGRERTLESWHYPTPYDLRCTCDQPAPLAYRNRKAHLKDLENEMGMGDV